MKAFAMLLALSVLLPVAVGEEPEYKGKSLDYWIGRTQTEHSVSERREAIRTLAEIAAAQCGRPPFAVSNNWVSVSIVPTLNGLLRDKDAAVREEAAMAFCRFTRKVGNEAIPALTELLGDPEAKVRQNAAGALSWRGPSVEPAIPALLKVLAQDASPEVRNRAATALRTGGPKGVASLLALLDSKSVEVRRTVLDVLQGKYPTEDPPETPMTALPKLTALLRDENVEIRKLAVVVLGRMSGAPPELIVPLLKDKSLEVRHVAATTLLYDTRDNAKRLRPQLLDFVQSDNEFCRKNPGLVARVGPKAIPILLKLLDDSSPTVRGHAASALGGFGPAAREASPSLKRLLTDFDEIPDGDLDDRVCHHAAEALNRILRDRDYREGLPYRRPDGL